MARIMRISVDSLSLVFRQKKIRTKVFLFSPSSPLSRKNC